MCRHGERKFTTIWRDTGWSTLNPQISWLGSTFVTLTSTSGPLFFILYQRLIHICSRKYEMCVLSIIISVITTCWSVAMSRFRTMINFMDAGWKAKINIIAKYLFIKGILHFYVLREYNTTIPSCARYFVKMKSSQFFPFFFHAWEWRISRRNRRKSLK